MNKIFKVVYNKTLGSWVAVNEFARGYCKNVSTKKLIASLALSGMAMGVLAQTTTVDLGTLRFDPTADGVPTDSNGPWGDNAGEGPIVAGAGESKILTGKLSGMIRPTGGGALLGWWLSDKNFNVAKEIIKTIYEPSSEQLANDNKLLTPDQFKNYLAQEGNVFLEASQSLSRGARKLIEYKDKITNLPTTFSVYDTEKLTYCYNAYRDCYGYRLSLYNPNPTLNPYTSTRVATAKDGGVLDIELDGGNTGNNQDTLSISLKNSSLFVAQGTEVLSN